jgi:type I restriction enzyme S subunit
MVRSLYGEWFVNFRYPGHERVKLVTTRAGYAPATWEVANLGELSAFISRGVSPKYDDDGAELVLNQKCIRDQRVSVEPARRHASRVPPDKYVRSGDVLINSTGVGTLGRVAQVLDMPERSTVDTHVTIARPKADLDATFYGVLLLSLQEQFETAGVGATGQTELNQSRIAATEVVMPPRALAARFGELVRPARALSLVLERKNRVLRQARDLLLPRLVSGEVPVGIET